MRIVFLLSILALASCDQKANFHEPLKEKANWFPQNTTSVKVESEDMLIANPEEQPLSSSVQIDRKLIKNATLVFKVSSIDNAKKQIDQLIKEVNGYPSTETQTNYDERLQYNLTVRVPSGRFDEFINSVLKLADKVDSKNTTTEDVTEQFIDTEARLKTKKRTGNSLSRNTKAGQNGRRDFIHRVAALQCENGD
jgi:Domain of unknown function (DUF4349)